MRRVWFCSGGFSFWVYISGLGRDLGLGVSFWLECTRPAISLASMKMSILCSHVTTMKMSILCSHVTTMLRQRYRVCAAISLHDLMKMLSMESDMLFGIYLKLYDARMYLRASDKMG